MGIPTFPISSEKPNSSAGMIRPSRTVNDYLAYLGFSHDDVKLNFSFLAALQSAHMTKVPFENLDIVAGRIPPVTISTSVEKIIGTGRGGWCFEANGSFFWLLSELGFQVRQLGASVLLQGPSTIVSHICLEVMLDKPYIVDVGFGDSFTRPMPFAACGLHIDPAATFELKEDGDGMILFKYDDDGVPQPQYRLQRQQRHVNEFADTAVMLGTDTNLPFAEKPFATRLLSGGPDRVTLLDNQLKIRKDGVWTRTPVAPEEWDDLLEQWFHFRRKVIRK